MHSPSLPCLSPDPMRRALSRHHGPPDTTALQMPLPRKALRQALSGTNYGHYGDYDYGDYDYGDYGDTLSKSLPTVW